MPITQQRFATIIAAARSFHDALQYLRAEIDREYDRAITGHTAATAALDNIRSSAIRTAPSGDHTFALGSEEKHYQLTRAKNARTAQRMRNQRLRHGITPRAQQLSGETFTIEEDDINTEANEMLTFGENSSLGATTADELAQQLLSDNQLAQETQQELDAIRAKEKGSSVKGQT